MSTSDKSETYSYDNYAAYWNYAYDYDTASSDVNWTLGNGTNFSYYVYDASAIPNNAPDGPLVIAIFGLIFFLGVPGNTLVVYVVCKNGAMKTVTNLFLVNLAIADLLFLTLCITFTGSAYVMSWPFGDGICKLVNYLMVVTMSVSVLTLAAMGVDRYYAIVKPIRSKLFRTIRRTTMKLLSIWIVTMVVQIPVAVISETVEFWDRGEERKYCVEKFEEFRYRQAYTMAVFVILFMIPFGVITICYLTMAKFLLTSVRPGETQLTSGTVNALKSRRKVAIMVLVVTLMFGFCWLPLHIVYLRSDFAPPGYSEFFDNFKIVAHCLSYANSAVNPIIYCFMSRHFRQGFKMAFTCKGNAPPTFPVADPEALHIPLFPRRVNANVARPSLVVPPSEEHNPSASIEEEVATNRAPLFVPRRARLDTLSTSM